MALRIDHSRVSYYIRKLQALGYEKLSIQQDGHDFKYTFRSPSGSYIYMSISENGWLNITKLDH